MEKDSRNIGEFLVPRIFVGTMYSGESEFEDCCIAIKSQKNVNVTQFVIANFPEYEAHNLLWKEWNSRKNDYDIFIKVDADTIIEDKEKFEKIAREFALNSRLTGMQIPLHDYFTDSLILGLNCFSTKVIFQPSNSPLHADHADKGHDIIYRNEQVSHLTPGGLHCKNPGTKQSFHYGVHRMKKRQVETISKVYDAWKKYKDQQRLLVLHGAISSFSMVNHDYSSDSFREEFERTISKDLLSRNEIDKIENFAKKFLGKS